MPLTSRNLRAATLAFLCALVVIAGLPADAQTEAVIYSFKGVSPDGYDPYGGVALGKNGVLYGTTAFGGTYGFGTVFKIDPDGTETVLHSFNSKSGDGFEPAAGVILDKAGNLYGTTYYGGAYGYGSVFKVIPNASKTETVVYSFGGQSGDGQNPWAGLVLDQAGNFYGTTVFGGAYGGGTVFKLTPTGTETVLYSFGSQSGDGSQPYGGVVLDDLGNLYGTNVFGGAYGGGGTVFKVTPTGTESVLYSFGGHSGDGAEPFAGVLRKGGVLYGTTIVGGTNGYGTVFKLTTRGKMTVLHNFSRFSEDGYQPSSGVVLDSAGNLIGTTQYGGVSGVSGTVFEITPDGTATVLHDFGSLGDGFGPVGGMVFDKAGNLYGTTEFGGAQGNGGTVYKLTP
jgi:uncharacterized repeat protein (TIGR03803 family)